MTNVATQQVIPDAYDRCRRIHRRHDPTYYWATRRLPVETRPAVHALYGFVRGADEIVDGRRRHPDPVVRRERLDAWKHALDDGLARGESDHPVIAALVDTAGRRQLDLHGLDRYMTSMRRDIDPVRIADWDDLQDYMQGSAGAVGRIMAVLLDVEPSERERFAQLGMAFQLANFVRDVREDWELDRVYLPQSDLDHFGVCEQELSGTESSDGLRATLRLQVERARGMFDETSATVDAVHPRMRPGMRLARAVYLRVLDRVERRDYHVLDARAGLGPGQLGLAVATSMWPRAARVPA